MNTNPTHYRQEDIQPVHVIETFFAQDAHLAHACKYMLRAGRKPDSSYLVDLGKALWWIARAIAARNGVIDLPDTVKPNMISINGKPVMGTPKTRKKK